MLNQGMGAWVHKRRVKSQGKVALIGSGLEITYDQLDERINALAHAFRDAGITQGDRVAYLGENHPAFLEVFYAATELGAIFVPLNTRLAPPELHYMLEDSGASILVHAEALTDLATRAAVGIDGVRLLTADTAGSPAGPSLDAFRADNPTDFIDVAVTHDDPAIILYTSGTTGHPKGAVLLHRNMIWNTMNALVDYDITSTDIALLIEVIEHEMNELAHEIEHVHQPAGK